MAGLNQLAMQAKAIWARLSGRQRLLAAVSALLMLTILGMLTHMLSTPEYKPLMVGLDAADAQAISAQLAAKGIPSRLGTDGKSIEVTADQLDPARLQIASEGTSHSGRLGFELFDKVAWGQTEFDEKVNYQRALEGELERTIGSLSDVKSARVHLVLAKDSVFLDRERGAKASVTLLLKRGELEKRQMQAISRLVSGAVDNLAAGDVVIIDADSNQTLNTAKSADGTELEQELAKRLTVTIEPAVGADNVRASVNVEYDPSTTEENQDKYDPAVSAVLTSQKSEEQTGAGAGTGGVAGTTSNLPTDVSQNTGALATTEDGVQNTKSESATFGVNKLSRHTMSPAGRIRRISAALLVNDAVERKLVSGKWSEIRRKRTAAELKQISDLAQAAIGLDTTRGDVISVQNMAFAQALEEGASPTALDRLRRGLTDYSSVVRYGALLALFILVWALMLRPVQKQVFVSMKQMMDGNLSVPAALSGGSASALEAAAGEVALDAVTDSAALKRQLISMAESEPLTMTRTIQAWLRDDHA